MTIKNDNHFDCATVILRKLTVGNINRHLGILIIDIKDIL